jgi:hypothetical protein
VIGGYCDELVALIVCKWLDKLSGHFNWLFVKSSG